METITYKTRKRVNFSVSVKGVVTPDCTVEGFDMTNESILSEAASLLDAAMAEAKNRSKGE